MTEPLEKPRTNEPVNDASSHDRDAAAAAAAAKSSPPPTKMEEPEQKTSSKIKQWWAKLGLNPSLIITMAKGALAPTIGIAMYEASSVAAMYATSGYLIAIISILSLCVLPRAKFMQNLLLALVGTCIGSALALLGIWASIKARQNATPANATPAQLKGYNSSQNAVCALWLILNIWFANTLRASRPALQIPVIVYSIFISVGMTSAVRFVTVAQMEAFIRGLLITFLTGLGLGAGVSWFTIPMSCRKIVFAEMTGYIALLQGVLKAQTAYMQSLKGETVLGLVSQENGAESKGHGQKKKAKAPAGRQPSPEALKLKAMLKAIGELHGKLHGDLPFAKRELAYGSFKASYLDDIYHHFRAILVPLMGMSTLADIFDRIYEVRGWGTDSGKNADGSGNVKNSNGTSITDAEVRRAEEQWELILGAMRKPFEHLCDTMVEALEHCSLTLQLKKAPKKKKGEANGTEQDVEANGGTVRPGTREFSAHFEGRTRDVYAQMLDALKKCTADRNKALKNTERLADDEENPTDPVQVKKWEGKEQYQLFLVLYMEHLFYSAAAAILDLVKYADGKVEDGTLTHKRLLYPDYAHLKKWVHSIFKTEDGTVDLNNPDSSEAGSHYVQEGLPLRKYDPEHLPPKNAWQRFGNGLRSIPHFLGSAESAFGLRVAAATMSVGIVCFLHNSQHFFFEQRLVWAMIIIAIGMTPTSGSATFGFIGRIVGTVIAMVNSYINWYIVDGHRAGVIVFLFIFLFIEFYFVLKYPRIIQIVILSIVTQVLIIGYELQVRKLGKKVATSNGQPYYPIYTLAPYRLATTAAGSLISYIWTIFPNPITDRSQIRKDLGKAMYLLANYYSCVHVSVGMWASGTSGNMDDKYAPGRRLEKIRYKLFGKQMLLLMGLRQHSAFTKFEPTVGGSFPKSVYDDMIQSVQNILQSMALISYATRSVQPDSSAYTIAHPTDSTIPPDPFSSRKQNPPSQWMKDLSELAKSIDVTSHSITTLLSLLAASVTNGQALPPYLVAPSPYNLIDRLQSMDKEILSVKHIEEPGYSAFAVMQVCSNMISNDMSKLLKNVKLLVGEVDFSYHIISTKDNQSSSTLSTISSASADGKGKQD